MAGVKISDILRSSLFKNVSIPGELCMLFCYVRVLCYVIEIHATIIDRPNKMENAFLEFSTLIQLKKNDYYITIPFHY